MPLRFDIRRKLTARSDRVKSVDLHPTEPWMVVSLYSGTMAVWNHETQTTVKTFEGCDVPVRVAKFVARKHWIVAGGDDMLIRVFNYNTLGKVHMFEAHHDYIRCIAVHPTQPYILTCSDDMLIKLWDWDQKWSCTQVFEGHTHYVMEVVFNPKDNNQFASASLDRTLKVWQLGSRTPNFTLEGHHKGVNSVDYYSGGDKPYLISGADDHLVKIWDYQNKTCVQTLEAHVHNVTCVRFHPELPIILSGSEDGTVRVWHSNTYRLENTLNYGMERVWCVCARPGSNNVALGYDDGSIIIQLGREEPAMSMDSSGKVIWAHYSEVQQANLKTMGETEIRDGEKLLLGVKDMGSCEIYPQTIQHSPNGRFVVICGDGEYIIYTAMALRNKSFGSAQEFVWAHDSSQYAIREGSTMVKIFKNFKQKTAFKPDFGAEGIFGGFLLGVRSRSGLDFYDWESTELIRRIEIQPKHIFWSDSGELVCIATNESFFVLRYLPEKVAAAQESKEEITEDGIEDAFEVLGEISGVVKTGVWVGDCFIFTSSLNRLNYYVGGEIVTIAHLDRTMYLLGYIPKDDRLYLGDKELNVISYSLVLSVLEYQTAVMRRDFGTADKVLPTIPREQRIRVAYFLEKQGYTQQALAVSNDPEHRFELALRLGEVQIAYQLASEAKSEQKWRQLAELATTKSQFSVAQECLLQAQDYGGLLLLATASGSVRIMENLAEGAERNEKTNVAFLTYFLQGRLDKCLDLLIRTDRLPEAAFLARTYLPSHVSRVVKLWKESLSKVNQKAADALADPTEYSNLFPGLQQALLAEQYLKETPLGVRPAAEYPLITLNEDRNVLEESAGFVLKGITESEDVAKGFIEPVREAAASEAVGTEIALREELIPPKEEITDLLQIEEKSIPALASSQPVAETEDIVEPKQAESVSFDKRATSYSEEASIIVEEDILATAAEVIRTETVTVKPSSPANVTSSFETDVQIVPPADDAVSSASETRPETDKTTEERPSEGPATEDPLVSPALTSGVAESLTTEEISVQKKMGTDVSSSEASLIVNTAAEEICLTDRLVAPVEEPMSSENTASPVPDELALVQILTERFLDPLLGSLTDKTQVLEPAVAQEQAQETQTTNLQAKTEENQELGASQGAEPRVSSPDRAPSEGNISDQDSHHDGANDPAVDLEAELDDETIPPADDALSAASESIITVEERASEIPATEDTLVSPGLTSCVSEYLATEEISVHEEMGTEMISPVASLIMNTAEEEICVTDGLVSDAPPLAGPGEEPILFTITASPASDGPVQAQNFTEPALDPLLDPTLDRTPVLQPAVEKVQEIQATGLSVKPEDNQLVTPPGAELRLSFTDTSADEALSVASETIKSAEEMSCETAATADILVSLGLTVVAESVATEEMPANKELGTDIVFPVAPLITGTAAGGICITDGLVSETAALFAPVEEPISSENTANPVQDGLAQARTFTEPVLDPLLDPLEDKTQVLKPAVAQEQAQETQTTGLPAKPGDNQELVAPLGSEPRVSSPDTARTVDDTVGQEAHLEGANDPAEDLEAELDDEALGYLDLDDLDLENIDTSDINLDEEFLME